MNPLHTTLLKSAIGAVTLGTVLAVALTTWNPNSFENAPAGQGLLLRGSQIPSSVRSILTRACQDCHSANTRWPWYATIPPLSWKIHDDVAQGRAFMDLSKWSEYSESQRKGYLAAIVAATQTRLMPPAKYVRLHREARLSDADVRCLQAWALAERKAIASEARRGRRPSSNE